eukprot:CAMPEP_0194277752 /NCGR_PEP_ID=MMETSP0169-20130528/9986_1 /TAXON_ID=218684 /ORGANISM="Corethron pennatum, Strain L29A3" /LENGTH=159 /DNA_ID=CAMNT_0039021787 /DNA_START=140 /DNA_END=619 /DNA_ORIENTATION=+
MAQEEEYQRFRKDLADSWASGTDYVLHTKFLFTKYRGADGRWRTTAPQTEGGDCGATVLALNDYPYNLEEGVCHWVLWVLGREVSEKDIAQAKADIVKKLSRDVDGRKGKGVSYSAAAATNLEFVHYVNPPHLQSFREIDHAHILYRSVTGVNSTIFRD